MKSMAAYDHDFYAWTQEQARLLRAGRAAELDYEHIAEELEDMGKSEKRRLESHLTQLLAHLLKWRYQPERRSPSWEITIIEQRARVKKTLTDSPSLKHTLPDTFSEAYWYARLEAARETGKPLEEFPQDLPWSLEQVMDEQFRPEG
jgi:hypothetical protein